jgi:predicted phosphodiesterase
MRYLVIGDLHANLEATEAVFHAAEGAYDQILCCGDLVGYGPSPNEVIERIAACQALCIRGNHDKVACGIGDASLFNEQAQQAIMWTRTALTPEHERFLYELPQGPILVDGDRYQLAHGSLLDEDEYIYSPEEAYDSLKDSATPISFVGHTHVWGAFSLRKNGFVQAGIDDMEKLQYDVWISLAGGSRYLINPGSVGQPRDGDPRAAFVFFDSEACAVMFKRVQYDIQKVQEKMRATSLPGYLIRRLEFGE